MHSSDKKIFELIEMFKANSTIRFEQDFCDLVNIPRQTLYRIKKELAHFTPEQIKNICKLYNVNANWIFGIEKNTFRTSTTSVSIKDKGNSMPATPTNK